MTNKNIKTEGKSISRRSALQLAGATVALTFPGPFISRAHARDVLYVNTWGGPWEEAAQKHLFEPFMKETGVEIKTVSPVSFAKLAAQVKTGVYEFDVTTLGDSDIVRANEAGIIEDASKAPLDQSKLWPGAVFQNGVGSHAFATLISYRKDKFPNGGPQSWADFFNPQKFPGTRCLQRHAGRVLAIALLADGVAPDKLYPMDLDRAFKALERIKPHLRVWWTQGPQSGQLLRDGEVDMIGIWQTYPVRLMREKQPVELVWNQALLDRAYWVVSKGSPRADLAWKFVQSAIRPERISKFALENIYGPLNPKAFEHVSTDDARLMPTSPENIKKVVIQDTSKASDQLQEASKQFERWIGR
ncbi:MAG: ABC transporter substrate-binding protein [Ferrovibrio sp.]|uniref:ABC transporter substrate-binding protein n=1 Tax=Ferrovibrio sp. TaxID=1917215 RepID=UPI00262BAA06|nr:ABC transporter substrate-binding protein [Ferrovibrio sp.]MCW0234214.1 ABC transporter substrate-binding protein [Ferrovibrio sp.]